MPSSANIIILHHRLRRRGAGILFIFLLVFFVVSADHHQLPNTTGVDGQLTANLKVDHFFSLWLVFNNDDVKISGMNP